MDEGIEKTLSGEVSQLREKYVKDAFEPVMKAIKAGAFDEADGLNSVKLPLYEALPKDRETR